MTDELTNKHCPKCTGLLKFVNFNTELHLYRCNQCYALWCKKSTLDLLLSIWMSDAVIDTGSPFIGRRLNKIDSAVLCPEGHGYMSHKIDPQQRHIGYEHCNICEGIYLDAGEFTDLKYLTILDRCRNAASTKKIKDGWNLFRANIGAGKLSPSTHLLIKSRWRE